MSCLAAVIRFSNVPERTYVFLKASAPSLPMSWHVWPMSVIPPYNYATIRCTSILKH